MKSQMFRIMNLLNDGKHLWLTWPGKTPFQWVDTSMIEDLKKIELAKASGRIR